MRVRIGQMLLLVLNVVVVAMLLFINAIALGMQERFSLSIVHRYATLCTLLTLGNALFVYR